MVGPPKNRPPMSHRKTDLGIHPAILATIRPHGLGTLNLWNTEEYDSFELAPGAFVLALTYESITVPKKLIALVEGRSTYARVGLSMHQTAPWIQPGFSRDGADP
jgi:deoxycytidine triphosphate deaminase